MATIIIDHILDHLIVAVDHARAAAATNARWLNAANAAYDWLLQQDSVEYDTSRWELTVESASTPDTFYHANGVCSCTAYKKDTACWHRAAARLVRRSLERQQRCEEADRTAYYAACREEFEPVYLAGISGVARAERRELARQVVEDLFG